MPAGFDALVRATITAHATRHPGWATLEGIKGHDHRLADPSAAAHERELADVRATRERLQATGGGRALDRAALDQALGWQAFELGDLAVWRTNPDASAAFLDHVFPLLIRTELPLDHRAAALAARLARAPSFLAAAREAVAVAAVPPLWVGVAQESAAQAPAFLDAVRGFAQDTEDPGALEAACDVAATALADHAAWLASDVTPRADGAFAIGRDRFDRLLRVRGLGTTAAELAKQGETLVTRFRAEVAAAARDIVADGDVTAAAAVVQADHPATFDDVLAAYRDAIEEARAFVADRAIMTVPAADAVPLDVIPTPTYLRHLIPFAAYFQPARFAPASRGTYLVTPKKDLSAFPVADIRNTTVHEAYPGHHLQLLTARDAPVARALSDATETIEGWALYCEWLLGHHGFSADPATRLVTARDALWRAVRVVLDVGLHVDGLEFDAAVERLASETGMDEADAKAEVKRYTLTPGYNLSYMIGRLRFQDLRARAEARPDWNERAFHDRVLAQGSIPIDLLAQALEADPERVRGV